MDSDDLLKEFCEELDIFEDSDINRILGNIRDKLNRKYYEDQQDIDSLKIVGSLGRGTAVEGISDVDVLYVLPNEIKKQFDKRKGNVQSQLLQEVKYCIKDLYSSTKIIGDGQVVSIDFSSYSFQIELVPVFVKDDDSYYFPDTHDDGSWKITKPMLEQKACAKLNKKSGSIYFSLCKMLRVWKSVSNISLSGLLIDSIVAEFLNKQDLIFNSRLDKNLLVELFGYVASFDEDRKYVLAIGSKQQVYFNEDCNYIKLAEQAHTSLKNSDSIEEILDVYLLLFGKKFNNVYKRNEKKLDLSVNINEQYIEDMFDIDLVEGLAVTCEMKRDGFRSRMFMSNYCLMNTIPTGWNLRFNASGNFDPDDKIYWKVRNSGKAAVERNMLRGSIFQGRLGEILNEHSDFYGSHYVEAYLVRAGRCIAKNKIRVTIGSKGN